MSDKHEVSEERLRQFARVHVRHEGSRSNTTLPSEELASIAQELERLRALSRQERPIIKDKTFETLLLSLRIRFEQMKQHQHTSISYDEIKTLFAGIATLAPPQPSAAPAVEGVCNCKLSDAWRCAVDQRLSTVSCSCSCHRTGRAAGEKS